MWRLPAYVGEFGFVAGSLALDFANTAAWHAAEEPDDLLCDFAGVVTWATTAGAISEAEARRLPKALLRRGARAQRAYAEVIRLREALYRIFAAASTSTDPAEDDLAVLNETLAAVSTGERVRYTSDGFRLSWDGEVGLLRILWPIARSAQELLLSDQLARVKECAGHPCGWLFVDTSKNRSRRWCDMSHCGNRAKARRHYERHRR